MSDNLQQLVAAYSWLQHERSQTAGPHRRALTAQIDGELDRLFLEIVRRPSEIPAVSALQIEFVIDQLTRIATDSEQANGLADICRAHLNAMTATRRRPACGAANRDAARDALRYLDSVSDRIGIIDRRYRYLMTNRQNADFHGRDVSDFIGRPAWHIVSEKYFDCLMRPSLDRCFANAHVDYVVKVDLPGPELVLSIVMDPVRDDDGPVTAVAVTARQLTSWDPAHVQVCR